MSKDHLAFLLGQVPKRAPYRKYIAASYAESTKLAYIGDVEHFKRWGGRIPATPMQLAQYLAAYAGKLSFATLSRRVAGIHREHVARGFKSPARSELARATLRGIARTYSRRQRRVKPLLVEHLRRMSPKMRGRFGIRDRALLLLGFFGGFRRSELCALNVEDLAFEQNRVSVTIRRGKTDQESVGRVVHIPRLGGPLCPVAALRRWLAIRPGSGFLFVSMFPMRLGNARITGQTVANTVKRRIAEIGLDPHEYSGHSLRSGFVTAAAMAGAAAWEIKHQTGHKSDAVLAGYIRIASADGVNLGRRIGGGKRHRA